MTIELKKLPKFTDAQVQEAGQRIRNWKVLNTGLHELNKDEVYTLIAVELQGKRRLPILSRLISRYSALEARENEAALRDAIKR